MPSSSDLSRHPTTVADSTPPSLDLSMYTNTVAEAVAAFAAAGMSVTDRTIQRYCQQQKLRAVRVDPDTREPTDTSNGVYLIDPSSIPERIAQLREREDTVRPTVATTAPDMSRRDATSRDLSQGVAPNETTADSELHQEVSDTVATLRERVATLEAENQALEIDKRVREGMLAQMKEDRTQLLETVAAQGREIGQLETKLQLAAPSPSASLQHGAPNEEIPLSFQGDNDAARVVRGDVE